FTMIPYFWMPETPVKRDSRMESVIHGWKQQGLIRETPGDSVDYDQVLENVIDILAPYTLGGFAFDRGFQGGQMGTNLMKHFGDLVEQFPQGIVSMNAPFRELIELTTKGKI